ncbi:hypothetical protein L1049_027326 [Liquidambar formosana]|uniref:RNase H type-1 domain-containing protein n=1 Tax=Liquidambar formosana TaxID=63359 RepID=A0AAP0R478_LIQFO
MEYIIEGVTASDFRTRKDKESGTEIVRVEAEAVRNQQIGGENPGFDQGIQTPFMGSMGESNKELDPVGLGQICTQVDRGQPDDNGPNVVEALGVHFAVQFVRELGLHSVMIEGDNWEVINAINSQETKLTALGLILYDVQDALIGHFGTITFGHIRRDGNKVAHGLARQARNVEGSIIWMEEVPCVVKDQYLYELSQCSS